jgi:hypothetical protein
VCDPIFTHTREGRECRFSHHRQGDTYGEDLREGFDSTFDQLS